MTREEAIDILDTLLNDGWLAPSLVPVDEAIRTAVEALKGDMYCPSCGVRLVPENEYTEPYNAVQHVQHVGSVGEWIPCSERLPSEGYTPVLISGYIEEVNYNSVQIARYRNGTWWYCDGSQEPVISKVTAWMPLPPVYQGGESE